MEAYFLDVGQGTCQVILLGDRRAIVVDCGAPNDLTLTRFLHRLGVETIARLIVSHTHADHAGGATTVLGDFQDRIDQICFVQDHGFLTSAFWKRICEFLQKGVLERDQLIRLEATRLPQLVWADASHDARLRTYSPSAVQNLLAQVGGQPNATSAVLFFDYHQSRMILASDSEVVQWREISEKAGGVVRCNVLSVPHHAGRSFADAGELQWLFENAIKPDVAVISLGTNNTHGHPREDVIGALHQSGATILCTQITGKCCHELEPLRPGVLKPLSLPGRSSPLKDASMRGNSRNVACAGTVRVLMSADGMAVDRLQDHQLAVDALAADPNGRPICRR